MVEKHWFKALGIVIAALIVVAILTGCGTSCTDGDYFSKTYSFTCRR